MPGGVGREQSRLVGGSGRVGMLGWLMHLHLLFVPVPGNFDQMI